MLKKVVLAAGAVLMGANLFNAAAASPDRTLIWSDEFNTDGPLNSEKWNFEEGFVRNHEFQWYADSNAYCQGGLLVLEARPANFPNPNYEEGSRDWRKSRKNIECTSASVNSTLNTEQSKLGHVSPLGLARGQLYGRSATKCLGRLVARLI